jgi:hypothetical protein
VAVVGGELGQQLQHALHLKVRELRERARATERSDVKSGDERHQRGQRFA